jgi:hypothetical protein
MVTEDYLKKTLGRTHNGKPFYPYANPLHPKNLDSPFGNFGPGNRGSRRELVFGSPVKTNNKSNSPFGSPAGSPARMSLTKLDPFAATANKTLTKGMGIGGKATSLMRPKKRIELFAPKAGAA